MVLLTKDETIFQRDENGNLLPQTIKVEGIGDNLEIQATPVPRGKLQRIFKEKREDIEDKKDYDGEIILEHCINPKYTAEDIVLMKPTFTKAIVTAILSLSMNIDQTKLKNITETVVNEEMALKKN